jgi:hypothetical protein
MARRSRIAVVGAAALVALAVALLVWAPWQDEADRIKGMIDWPSDCASVTIERNTAGLRRDWPRATSSAIIACNMLGGFVVYGEFPSAGALRAQLRAAPPDGDYCVAGRKLVLDALFSGFEDVCAKLDGRLSHAGA